MFCFLYSIIPRFSGFRFLLNVVLVALPSKVYTVICASVFCFGLLLVFEVLFTQHFQGVMVPYSNGASLRRLLKDFFGSSTHWYLLGVFLSQRLSWNVMVLYQKIVLYL